MKTQLFLVEVNPQWHEKYYFTMELLSMNTVKL
jgi:hypothetical protein